MKISRKIVLCALLSMCLLVCGAWAPYSESEQTRYGDAPTFSAYADERVSYTSKDDNDLSSTAGGCPQFRPMSDLPNSCGSVAGAMIAAYYDKYFSELIPDWVSYYTASGKYRAQDTKYVPEVIREMYTLMQTNVVDVGVSSQEFLDGLKKYINNHGYSVEYRNVMSGGKVDYEACKRAFAENKIVVLFSEACNVNNISGGSGYDSIAETRIGGLHIMVAYGHRQIKYYNSNGLFRTDTYLQVATGLTSTTTAFYNINTNTLNEAYTVVIS